MNANTDAQAEIKALIESWAAAVRRKDMDGILVDSVERDAPRTT